MIWILYLVIAFIVSVLCFRYNVKEDLIAGVKYDDARGERMGESIAVGIFWIVVLLFYICVGLVKLVEITANVTPKEMTPTVPEEVKKIDPTETKIAELLKYSFADIKFNFAKLTPKERKIVGDSESFDEILLWVAQRSA